MRKKRGANVGAKIGRVVVKAGKGVVCVVVGLGLWAVCRCLAGGAKVDIDNDPWARVDFDTHFAWEDTYRDC